MLFTTLVTKKIIIFYIILSLFGLTFLLAKITLAQPIIDPIDGADETINPAFDNQPVVLTNPLGDIDDPRVLIGLIIRAALGVVGSLALAVFIYGGLVWMTAAGNEDKVAKAKDTIKRAIIGLIIIIAAYSITYFVFKYMPWGGGGGGSSPVFQ